MISKLSNIVVLYGGISFESEVSIASGKAAYDALIDMGYKNVYLLDFNRQNIDYLFKNQIDVVFNALHGTYGEDGCVPGLLETLNIPYTHSGVLASALAMNKQATKTILQNEDIRFPNGIKLHIDDLSIEKIAEMVPCVIKPVSQGSSVGVKIIHSKLGIAKIIEELKSIDNEFLIEEFIPNRELSVAVTDHEPLGVMELIPKSGFFDYENKYTKGMTEHVVPAKINSQIYDEAMNFAFKAHKALGCRGISRSDFRYDDKEDKLYFLELNTHPGLTPVSIAPHIAKYKGISFNSLVEYLLDTAKLDNQPNSLN